MYRNTLIKSMLSLGIALSVNSFAHAQASVNSSGGEATGTNGVASYSIGQPFFQTISEQAGTAVEEGVQHAQDGNHPLPLGLLEFTAQKAGEQSELNWITTLNEGTGVFVIQRSPDSRTWQSIDSLSFHSKQGNLTNKYLYFDQKPLNGENFYRLKIKGEAGDLSYSKVRTVYFENTVQVTYYPNPASEAVTISGLENYNQIMVFDNQGRKILEKEITSSTEVIKTDNLSQGIYLFQLIKANGKTLTFKITKK